MKKKIVIRLLAMSLAASLLAGCGQEIVTRDVSSYPLVNALTQQELMDYYAESMKYDSIISRNVTVHETTYVTKDIDGAKAEKLKGLVSQCESILSQNEYEPTIENVSVMSEDVYNYIKTTIDSVALSNGTVTNMRGALGFYFVDVEYDINAKTPGQFNQMTPLIGVDGAFCSAPESGYTIDIAYIITIAKKLNEYFAENGIMKAATVDMENAIFQVNEGLDPNLYLKTKDITNGEISTEVDVSGSKNPVSVETPDENSGGAGENGEYDPDENGETGETVEEENVIFDEEGNVVDEEGNIIYTPEQWEEIQEEEETEKEVIEEMQGNGSNIDSLDGLTYASIVSDDRKITLDTDLIRSVVGASLKQKAFLPDLNLVYSKPESEGTICGYGIYTEGVNGLRVFGFDRASLAGKCTVRYVFKDAIDGSDNIIGVNAYVTDYEISNGFNVTDQNLVIPKFLQQQFEMLVDRSDRVMINCDISGLMNNNIYQDMGVAVLRGYKELYCNTLKYMSTIRQVIARDTATNSYLIEIETTIQDGAKAADSYGNYRDKYYLVIQQQGTEFVIADSIRVSREMTKEPSIDPDEAITKRLVALNLAGEVTDEAKSAVTKLLSDWYTASSNRLLYAHDSNGNLKTITVDGQEITLERGMYDCFQSDTSMLSSEDLEYTQSKMRAQLDKYGTGVGVFYNGTITEWIGGSENQVELTTEELITYAGVEDAHYVRVYYLVSNMNDVWVIDERTVLDERDVSGTELDNIKSRL